MVATRRLTLAVLVALTLFLAAYAEAANMRVQVVRKNPTGGPPATSNNDDDPSTAGVQVSPTSGSARSVTVDVNVSDDNGHNDVTSVTLTVYKEDQTTVHVASFGATKSTGSGRSSTWNRAFDMAYHDAPGTYWVKTEVQDRDGDTDVKWSSFTYQSLVSIGMSASTVSLNPGGDPSQPLTAGTSTTTTPTLVNLTNRGNVLVDLSYSGTALTNGTTGDTIPVGNISLSLSSNMSGAVQVGTSAATLSAFDLPAGADSSKGVYVAISVPSGIRSGNYTGTLTLSAVANSG